MLVIITLTKIVVILSLVDAKRHHSVFKKTLDNNNNKIKRNKDIDLKCIDPETHYLENLYSDYVFFYRKYEEVIYKSKAFQNQDSDLMSKKPLQELFDNTECRYSKRNTTDISRSSMCAWRNILEYRKDKYPHYILEAKCSCTTCNLRDDKQLSDAYKCLPVYRPEPVLVRGECAPDGYYRWIPTVEAINFACTCGYSNILRIF